jgi:APA family basic amino acid/polyamine antiporter
MTGSGARKIGFWALLALCIGNTIGSGIYLLPAQLAPLGWNQMIGWLITIGGALSLAWVFARLSAQLPLSGGPYAYAQAAFGPVGGFTSAWAYWVMCWTGNAAIAVAVVSNVSLLVPSLGTTPGLPAVLAVAMVWLVTVINIRGVQSASRVQELTVVLKLLPLVVLIALALWLWLSGAERAPDPGVTISGNAIATAVGLTFWGFLGLEAGTVPADKVADPARNIPRATVAGVVITGLIYLGISMAFAVYMPIDEAARSPAPIADFLGRYLGATVAGTVALFAAISAFGTLNGWVLVQAEMPWAMARGGVFPAWFGADSSRGTPLRAHLLSSTLLTLVTLSNYQKGMGDLFTAIASISLVAAMLSYLLTALAALRLARADLRLILAAMISAGFTLWATWGLGREAILYVAVLMALGLPVYLWVRTARSS